MLALLLLAGCNTANIQSTAPEPEAVAEQAPAATDNAPPSSGSTSASAEPATGAETLSAGLEQLANRLTLVQEQLIQLKARSAELGQQSQQVLARLQMLTEPAAAPADETDREHPVPAQGDQSAALGGLIDQLGMIANELSVGGAGDAFRIVATYTATGEWILIRFDRFSGETWLADQGGWKPLIDIESTPSSEYDVVLERAEKDVKGYAAARLDKRSGETWWLNKDSWQKFD
ncbi:hypothetical protein [Marinobacterium aestuariivivens]|uniref:Uncharacterized protein n=1 Tax=Marinobacterium aestuariivivens TaxID=1698799 RepID=A0ABW2A4V3_9GAMM